MNTHVSKKGRKALRRRITKLQSGQKPLPKGVMPDGSTVMFKWPLSRLTAKQLVEKAIALGVTDFTPYEGRKPTSSAVRGGRPQRTKRTKRTKSRKVAVVPNGNTVTPAPSGKVASLTRKPKAGLATGLSAYDKLGPLPKGAVRVTAAKAFGLRFDALKDVFVDIFPKGLHDRVPSRTPGAYLGYEDGKVLRDILDTMNRVHWLPAEEQFLSNVAVWGHKGTGKSLMMREIAAVTRRPYFNISIRRQTTALDLLGDFDTRSVGQGEDADVWLNGLLIKAACEHDNAIVCLDEFSKGILLGAALNGPLQDRKLQIMEIGKEIPFGKGVNMVITNNDDMSEDPDGIYDGGDIDISLVDRWPTFVEMPYLPHDREVKVLQSKTGCDTLLADAVTKVVGCLREVADTDEGDARLRPSLRQSQSWVLAIQSGRDMIRSFGQSILNGISKETKEAALVVLVDQVPATQLGRPLTYTDTPSSE